jgi:hypothetical protein
MFLWTGRQAVFLLVMLVVSAMALTHPVWRHWYEMVFPRWHHYGNFGVGLRHEEVSEEKQCVKVRCLGANAAEETPRKVNR